MASTCALVAKGAPLADFVDAASADPAALKELAQVHSVYGCLLIQSRKKVPQWYCANDETSTAALASPCPIAVQEQACQGDYTLEVASSPPQTITVQGCLQDEDGSYCWSGGRRLTCTPSELLQQENNSSTRNPDSNSSMQNHKASPVPVIVGSVVGVLAIVALLAIFLVWRKRRIQRNNNLAAGNKVTMGSKTIPGSAMYSVSGGPSSLHSQEMVHNDTSSLSPNHGYGAIASESDYPFTSFSSLQPSHMATTSALAIGNRSSSKMSPSPDLDYSSHNIQSSTTSLTSSKLLLHHTQSHHSVGSTGVQNLSLNNRQLPYLTQIEHQPNDYTPYPYQDDDNDQIELDNRYIEPIPAPATLLPLQFLRNNSSLSVNAFADGHRLLQNKYSMSSLRQDMLNETVEGSDRYLYSDGPPGTSNRSSPSSARQQRMSKASFTFVPPRPSLSLETNLPALSSTGGSSRTSSDAFQSRVSIGSLNAATVIAATIAVPSPLGLGTSAPHYRHSSISTEDEVFPRPYRTYVNVDGGAPEFRDAIPNLPSPNTGGIVKKKGSAHNLRINALKEKLIPPPSFVVEYYPMYFNSLVPVRSTKTHLDSAITRSKAQLPLYSLQELHSTYDNLCNTLINLVQQSFTIMGQNPNTPNLSAQLYSTITQGEPLPSDLQVAWTASQFAFLSLFVKTLTSDIFVAITTAMRMEAHIIFVKKYIPELKKDIKHNLSTQLLFQAFDYLLSSPTLSTHLIGYLQPTLTHASNTLSDLFNVYGLPPPSPQSFDDLLQALLDWLVRLKREHPGVGLYVPHDGGQVQTEWMQVAGGEGSCVAFTLWPGLWNAETGQMGYPAQVWLK